MRVAIHKSRHQGFPHHINHLGIGSLKFCDIFFRTDRRNLPTTDGNGLYRNPVIFHRDNIAVKINSISRMHWNNFHTLAEDLLIIFLV
ncbi:hypothetical protein D3C72_1176760 [compost metagenome]